MDAQEEAALKPDPVVGYTSYTALFDAYVDEVYRFVHRRCRDHSLAEDITQETFITAVRTVDDPTTVSIGWLKQVARNRLVDVLRRQKRYQVKLRLLAPSEPDGHESLLAETLRVEAALENLSIDHRLVLTLHYIDGFTVPELAKDLERSVKSVEALITRARRRLRLELGGTDG